MSVAMPATVTSSVWLGPFELKMYETFTIPRTEAVKRNSRLVLRQVAPWLRPFCRVNWK